LDGFNIGVGICRSFLAGTDLRRLTKKGEAFLRVGRIAREARCVGPWELPRSDTPFLHDQGGAMKKIPIFLILSLMSWVEPAVCLAGGAWFSKEKEVKDEYLEKLFVPEVPYEWVKVLEDEKENRFIGVRLKEKATNEIMNGYGHLLLNRGVNIYGTFHYGHFSWQETVTDYAVTITRKVEGEANAVEISESVVLHPKKKEPIVAMAVRDKEIRIAIEKELGKRWRKVEIIPAKELEYPEPQIGRYPGSKLRDVIVSPGGHVSKFYVSNAPVKDIFGFYHTRMKERFAKVYSRALEDLSNRFEDPKLYALPFKIFGIRTICQNYSLSGYEPLSGIQSERIDIRRSLDINLKDFVQIYINER
jgi:hypothetical protein